MSEAANKRDVNVAGFADLECDRLRIKRTRIDASTRAKVYLTLPSTDGELALNTSIPDPAGLVTVGFPNQTITSVKTFAAAPVISTITNGAATITVPSSTGTLALVSQLPDTSGFVTLGAPNQSITSVKTFTSAPVISTITNGAATLTLPSSTGTLALVSQLPTNYVDTTTSLQQAAGKEWLTQTQMDASLTVTSGNVAVASAGTASTPAHAITSSTGLGMYSGATNQLNFSTNSANRFQIGNGVITSTVRNQGPSGNNASVTWGCGNTNEGLYFNTTTNTIVLADGSTATDVCRFAGTRTPVQTTNPGVIVAVSGSLATASLRFDSDTAAGWYSSGANQWTFTTGLAAILTLSSAGANLNNSFLLNTFLANNTTLHVDTTDTTKRIAYLSSGAATGTTLTLSSTLPAAVNHTFAFTANTTAVTTTLSSTSTANRVITLPNATCNLISDNTAQTISATKTFTALQIFDSGGVKLGANGTLRSIQISGSIGTSTVLGPGANGVLSTFNISGLGFGAMPTCIFTIAQPAGGASNWDRVIVSLDTQNSSSTQVQIVGVNTAIVGSTSGTASINYIIFA